ncbi:MAG: adenylate/guanylate cyclase domain-containing protein [Candidatus Micrarchaeota archaeon]
MTEERGLDFARVVFLFFLTWVFYGVVRSALSYKRKREFKYLLAVCLFLLLASDLWLRAYEVRLQAFLDAFRVVLSFVPVGAFLLFNYLEEQKLKERAGREKVTSFFSRYVSPHVVKKLVEKGRIDVGGKRRPITILFTDIRGFTTLSEKMQPEEVVDFLNGYFESSTRIVQAREGTIDKFIGDAVMAIYNAPLEITSHAEAAVLSALEMQEDFERQNASFKKKHPGKSLGVGIGINSGEAVVGNIGSKSYVEYTCIGDAVNTASRLQGKAAAGEIVVSEPTYSLLPAGKYAPARVEEVLVKGKAKPLKVFVLTTKSCRKALNAAGRK